MWGGLSASGHAVSSSIWEPILPGQTCCFVCAAAAQGGRIRAAVGLYAFKRAATVGVRVRAGETAAASGKNGKGRRRYVLLNKAAWGALSMWRSRRAACKVVWAAARSTCVQPSKWTARPRHRRFCSGQTPRLRVLADFMIPRSPGRQLAGAFLCRLRTHMQYRGERV